MLFNSIPFLAFAIVFFALWPLANRSSASRWSFLTGMSFLFYGWWDWRFLFLIIGSGLIDYVSGWAMQRFSAQKRLFLWCSLFGNLGSLAVFKYSIFFAESLEGFFAFLHWSIDLQSRIPEFALILPVGISFFTFQSMSYTIDIYRGKLKPTPNILHFFSYLALFPQLVAGPIIRARDLLKQLAERRTANAQQRWHAAKLIVFGLFQKTVLADNIGVLVDTAYLGRTSFDDSLFWWVALIGFAMQIYCDFSGYSLMARGLAKLMGYHFKMNFNHPYLALSMRDFWARWHISLSSWFRDYVYIPLGGSRKGFWAGLAFMSLTMLVSGLWHGAAFTFLAWGALHALFLVLERVTRWPQKLRQIPALEFPLRLLIFIQVLLAWNYFRAESFEQAHQIFAKLFSGGFSTAFVSKFPDAVIFLCLGLLIELSMYVKNRFPATKQLYYRLNLDVLVMVIALLACLFLRGEQAQFIYFQF